MARRLEDMTVNELKDKLKSLRDNLCDVEDMHSFTFDKTSLHIGSEKAQNMQTEFEEECVMYADQIAAVEKVLQARESDFSLP
jgi:hypothetical protein